MSDYKIIRGMLFDADYIDVGGKAWVRLWIKDDLGNTLVVYDPNFEPYFYAIVDPERNINEVADRISQINGVKRTEIIRRKNFGKEIDVIKITVDFPKNVPSLRETIKNVEGVLEVREADIPFAIRYIIDKNLRPMDGIECEVMPVFERKLKYPEYMAKSVKHVELEKECPLRILAFDIEVSNPEISVDPEKDEIIMISYSMGPSYEDCQVIVSDGDEKELIEKFYRLIREYDPDIILTYNGNDFDWPYLKKRAEKHGITLSIGRDGSTLLIRPAGYRREARAVGRALVDLYNIVERDLPEVKVKTLKNIAQYLGVMKKSERVMLRPQDILKYWEDPELRKDLIQYSKDDALATYLVGQELLPLQYEISKLIRQPLSRSYAMSRGRQVDWYLVSEAYKLGELAPNKTEVGEETIYEGALVLEPEKGLFENVLYLDFGSMYPTIMITYNISPDTYVPPYEEVSEDNIYIAPEVGHRFLKSPDGFYRHILRKLIERRKMIKSEMKKYAKDSKEYKVLNVRQLALKTLANSFYGYTGWVGARWYKRECAEATTAWGRHFIRIVKQKAEQYGIKVLYGDTDSIFVLDHPKIKEFIDEVNRTLPLELELETIFKRVLFTGVKKRYAGITQSGEIYVRGLEVRRGDWCELAKEVQEKVIEIVLQEGNPQKAKKYVQEIIKTLKKGGLTEELLEKLVIYKTITRSLEDYVSEQAHVRAVKEAIKRGFKYRPGMKVGILIIKGPGEKISDRAIVYDLFDPSVHKVDVDYYIDNQIIPAALRILSVFGITESELKVGHKQKTLFEL